MIISNEVIRMVGSGVRHVFVGASLSVFFLLGTAAAQTSSTDGTTPSLLTAGAPSGSYGLSGFDNVNLFNGNLNFGMPLVHIGGRGAVEYTMTLPIETHWRVLDRSTDSQEILLPTDHTWYGDMPGYSPGILLGRAAATDPSGGGAPCGTYYATTYQSLTRLTFILPDGTEYEFRDQATGGQQKTSYCSTNGYNRGTVFVTADGTAATFVSDAPIYDTPGTYTTYASGYLSLASGLRYRIDNGHVSWMRDRNGNKLTFVYGEYGVTSITDSLNRQVTVTYADFQTVFYDQINFKGFGGAQRTIRINYSVLQNVLRTDRPGDVSSVQTLHALFPELTGSSTTNYSPYKVSSVVLPDGVQQYQFAYNVYGELARVILPTGGMFEYEFMSGSGESTDGVLSGTPPQIYRRVSEKRVYRDATTQENRTVFGGTVDVFDAAGTLLSREKHYFYSSPTGNSVGIAPFDYPVWNDGKEYQTEMIDTANCSPATCSTVLRRISNTWEQGCPVSSWSSVVANNPRVVETTTTLVDTNQVAKQTFGYDCFNNKTDTYEYDYGSGSPGSLVRHHQTNYIVATSYTDAVSGAHLRSLPTQQSVYDATGVERARATFEYDNYTPDTNHAALTDRPSISGFDSSFSTSYSTRGNVTGTTRYLLTGGSVTGSVSGYAQYDIAGNVVKAIDPRSTSANVIASYFDYRDNFGAPGDAVQSNGLPVNSAPSGLGGLSAYAFPFAVTNALGHVTYAKFDYDLGRVVAGEDANHVTSSGYYDDALDRPTKVIRAANLPDNKSQSIFTYDDANRKITTTSDQSIVADGVLKAESYYDGLGRTIESRSYEGGSNYIAGQTQYDALGRAYRTSNPFRPWQNEVAIWTTRVFDSLGRVTSMTAPDGAIVKTAYSGNRVLVADQNTSDSLRRKRISVSDGLGRLKEVWEVTGADSATESVTFPGYSDVVAGYVTRYDYDVLDDLINVSQKVGTSGTLQTRTFAYDSLKRLSSATNPESGTISYQYDYDGNLTQKTDARGVVATYGYDALNRNITVDYSNTTPNPDIQRYYDNTINYGKGRFWYDLYYQPDGTINHQAVDGYDPMGRVWVKRQVFSSGGNWYHYESRQTYDLAGHAKTVQYPSGHTVTYNYDSAGRLADNGTNLAFTGNLGDGTSRTYASGNVYSPFGGLTKEQFGTTTPVYNKLFYNSRGQLAEIRESTSYTGPTDTTWDRGAIVNSYSASCTGLCGGSNSTTQMLDNNGNLRTQSIQIPGSDTFNQSYSYDSLNRLLSVTENKNGGATNWQQQYIYDRYGNRTIDQTNTWGANIAKPNFGIDQATNRLTPSSGTMTYDNAGNLTTDTYSGAAVTRTYDAENRMTQETQANNFVAGAYSYDADGHRARRKVNGIETWQVYGPNGELLAEYAPMAAASSPQKEYGYRNGQSLITADAPTGGGGGGTQNVTWTNAVGVSVSGNSLTKTAADGWGNSGASSTQTIASGDGYVEFTATETTTARMCGLAHSDPDQGSAIDFALAPYFGGTLYKFEFGTYTQVGTYTTGDVLRVAVESGVVTYRKNGTVISTSTTAPTYPLLVDTSLYTNGATITNAVINSGGGGSSSQIHWLVTDQLGTPRMVFDQSGSLANVSRHDYLPFGEDVPSTFRSGIPGYSVGDTVRQKFTGYEADGESQLNFAEARYHSSSLGRFTSADPLPASMSTANPQSFNRYTYVLNSPTNLTDPSGMVNSHGDSMYPWAGDPWGDIPWRNGTESNGNSSSSSSAPYSSRWARSATQATAARRSAAFFGGSAPQDPRNGGPRLGQPAADATAVSATGGRNLTTIITWSDGTEEVRQGGDPAWRNNNPGNIRPGSNPLQGDIGSANGFVVFPSVAVGDAAIIELLNRPYYQNRTVGGAIAEWAPARDRNNPAAYAAFVQRVSGLSVGAIMNTLTAPQIRSIADAIESMERANPGTVTYRSTR